MNKFSDWSPGHDQLYSRIFNSSGNFIFISTAFIHFLLELFLPVQQYSFRHLQYIIVRFNDTPLTYGP